MLKRKIFCGVLCGGFLLIWSAVLSSAQQGKILFSSDRSGSPEIYGMDPDGSDVVRVTKNGGYHFNASLAPDGTKIVLTMSTGGGQATEG